MEKAVIAKMKAAADELLEKLAALLGSSTHVDGRNKTFDEMALAANAIGDLHLAEFDIHNVLVRNLLPASKRFAEKREVNSSVGQGDQSGIHQTSLDSKALGSAFGPDFSVSLPVRVN